MRQAGVYALLAVSCMLFTELSARQILHAPANLTAKVEDDTTAMLYWNFTESEDADPAEITFGIGVQTLVEPGINRTHLMKTLARPFVFHLRGLRPQTNYTVKLWAIYPTGAKSLDVETSFVTKQEDWPTPSFTGLTRTRRPEAMLYTVSWKLSRELRCLSHFDIVYCTGGCEKVRARFFDSNVSVPIKFYTRYTINITAFYEVPLVGMVPRESSLLSGTSEMGSPSKIQNITIIVQEGNKLRIEWLPSSPANGPISYHEVFVHDPRSPILMSWVKVGSGPAATVMGPVLEGDLYKIEIRAVNVDASGAEYKGEFAVFDHERILPPGTQYVKTLSRGAKTIVFKTVPDYEQENLIFCVESDGVDLVRVSERAPDEHKLTNLKPFQEYPISVRVCYPTNDASMHTCGEYKHLKLQSNVGEPSRARDVTVRYTDNNSMIVQWEAPDTPNGPIDMYLVRVQAVMHVSRRIVEKRLLSRVPWVAIMRDIRWKSVTFGIAAMNSDLDDENHVLEGPMVFVTAPPPPKGIDFVILISCGVLTCVTFFSLKSFCRPCQHRGVNGDQDDGQNQHDDGFGGDGDDDDQPSVG